MSAEQPIATLNLPYSAYLRRALLSTPEHKITNTRNDYSNLLKNNLNTNISSVMDMFNKKKTKHS